MTSGWRWVVDNKEWLFSGAGILVIGYFVKIFFRKTPANNQKVTVKSDSVSTNSPSAIGHTVTQSVNYQFVGATSVPAGGLRGENKPTSPTAHQILKALAALPPFQRKSAGENYIGLEICWLMEFVNIDQNISTKGEDYSLMLSVRGKEAWDLKFASCTVDLTKYPKLKILHAGHPIWLRGKISSFNNPDIVRVTEPELEILDLPE
jgi:hypothetical protein